MSIDPVAKEAIITEAYNLHVNFRWLPYEKKKISEFDAKIQQFIKHYQAFDAAGAEDLLSTYEEGIKPPIQKLTEYRSPYFPLWESEKDALRKAMESACTAFEQCFISHFNDKMPDLQMKERMKRQDAFSRAVDDACWGRDFERIEEILKEGPIDINACKGFLNTDRSILQNLLVLHHSQSNNVLTLLLKNGAKLHKEYLGDLITYFQDLPITAELLELMIQQGFDLNATTEKGASLLGSKLEWHRDVEQRLLVFYGAGRRENRSFFQPGEPPARNYVISRLAEEMDVRECVLQEMQKPKDFPISQFSPAEREIFVKRCFDKKQFRDLYEVHTLIKMTYCTDESTDPRKEKIDVMMRGVAYEPDKDWKIPPEAAASLVAHYEKTIPDLEKRINQHNQFIKVCLEGDLEAASALLKEGPIELNSLMVPRQYPEDQWTLSKTYPLFHHACLKGDLKLIDFLIKAGVNINAAYNGGITSSDKHYTWLPAIIEAILFTQENRQEVIDRLLKEGADVNQKDNAGFLWAKFERLPIHFNPSSSKINALEALHTFIRCGLDFDVIQSIYKKIEKNNWFWYEGGFDSRVYQKREHDSPRDIAKYDLRQELLTTMIYYGADVNYSHLYGHDSVKKYVEDAVKIRDEVLQEMLKKELGEAEDLLKFSMDLVGIVGGYGDPNEIVQHLNPQERLDLFQRCQKKAAFATLPPAPKE